jgi:hypothetical protein
MWTKRQIVNQNFTELALACYEFELTPEETNGALVLLDALMAEWQNEGIYLGYALPTSPGDSDLDDPSGLPDYAVRAVWTNLAVARAAAFGKAVPPTLQVAAMQSKSKLYAQAAIPPQQQLRGSMPIGAGNKYWAAPGRRFVRPPDLSPVQTSGNGNLDFLEG